MVNNASMAYKRTNMLVKLLPLLAFIVPIVILYFVDPVVFEKTWKGRIFYVFFLWLISLEIILSWEELQPAKIKLKSSIRSVVFVLALSLPTVYVFVCLNGLNTAIQNLASEGGIFWASVMPLSTEYLVFAALFALIILLEYGVHGLKVHSISAVFLAIIGVIYTIDNIYPNGQFTPFQIIVPTTASLAAGLLNFLGYHTAWLPTYAGMPSLVAIGSNGASWAASIAWPCSGVESLLIYAVTILLFLRNSFISWKQRIVYFVFGGAVTYFINIVRIATIFIIGINSGPSAALTFHDYYGQLYSVSWIVCYPLLIMGSQALVGRIRNQHDPQKGLVPAN